MKRALCLLLLLGVGVCVTTPSSAQDLSTFQFSELVTPEAGYVLGIDSNGRNKQNRETNPPGHAMSGLRFTATQRELRRASPALLIEMRNHPDRVTTSPAITIGSVSYPALTYQAGPYAFIVLFDPQTHLPARPLHPQ